LNFLSTAGKHAKENDMKRVSAHWSKVVSIAVLIVSVTTTVVFAASPHYKRGGQPVCTGVVNGATITVQCSEGQASGLGNEDIRIVVTLNGSAGTFCHNPGNSNVVPGQNPATGTSATPVDIPGSAVKNGNATLPAITASLTVTTPTAAAAGCPNDNWTVTLGPATFSGHYSFQQPAGTEIPSLSFDF
jgi:hypothetical protein